MPEMNYPSASEMVRNLSQIHVHYDLLMEHGKFRVVRFSAPYYEGFEFWVVNEKGFMWEGADSEDDVLKYLRSEEAQQYNT